MPTATPPGDAEQETPVDIVGRHRRLGARTALISGLTFVSRILGYVREMVSAYLFGDSSGIYDAFITAWRVPNLFRRFLGEGALSTSLQTALTEVDGDRGLQAGRRLFQETLWLVSWVLLALCAVVMIAVAFLPTAMPFTGWAWLGEDPEAVRELTLRVMPFCLLICISAAIGGALQVRGHFAAPAWAPAVFNVVWIGTLLFIGMQFGFRSELSGDALDGRQFEMTKILSYGVLAAGVVQLAFQVPALMATGLIGRLGRGSAQLTSKVIEPAARTAWSVLRTSAPLAIGAAVYQVNVMVDGLMAESLLPDGGPTLHYYANRLQQFPLALIAVAATSAVFPSLKALGHRGQFKELRSLHDKTQLAISFVALPASVGLFFLAKPIVQVSLEHGAFGPEGVRRTSEALRALSLAILPAGATGLVARTYYALGDFRTPVQVSVAALTVNVALNVLFIVGLGFDVSGLAWATAITSWGGLFGLLFLLPKRTELGPASQPFAKRLLGHLFCAVLSGSAALYALRLAFLAGETSVERALRLGVSVLVALVCWFGSALILRLPEAEAVKAKAVGKQKTRR